MLQWTPPQKCTHKCLHLTVSFLHLCTYNRTHILPSVSTAQRCSDRQTHLQMLRQLCVGARVPCCLFRSPMLAFPHYPSPALFTSPGAFKASFYISFLIVSTPPSSVSSFNADFPAISLLSCSHLSCLCFLAGQKRNWDPAHSGKQRYESDLVFMCCFYIWLYISCVYDTAEPLRGELQVTPLACSAASRYKNCICNKKQKQAR